MAAKKKVVVEGVEEVFASTEDYKNEFRVYGADSEFVSFETVEEAQARAEHRYVAWVIGDLELNQLATKYQLNEVYAREAALRDITS